MSKQDYTKFSHLKETMNDEIIQNGVVVNLKEELDTEEEITPILDALEEIPDSYEIEVINDPEVIGVVVNCTKLNVRKTPNPYGEVIGTIDVNSEVTIDEAESTGEFYKICTAAGAEGFCVKKFIQVK